VSAADLLRDYWIVMPVAIVLDALILGGMSYGIWRAIKKWVRREA
jgi:hypothetical protein